MRGRRARIVTAAVAAALALALPVRAAERAGIVEVARVGSNMLAPRFLEMDAPARRLFDIGQPIGGTGLRVQAYDLDSLAPLAAIDIPGAQSASVPQRAAVDDLHHRLFLVYAMRPGGTRLPEVVAETTDSARTVFGIAIVDTLRLKLLASVPLLDVLVSPDDPSLPNNGTTGVKAMSYYGPEDRLYVVTEESTARQASVILDTHGVFLHEFEASRLAEGASARTWTYPVPQCPSVMGTAEHSVVLRAPAAVYVPCRVPEAFADSGIPPPEPGGIVRVNLAPVRLPTDLATFSADFFPIAGNLTRGPVTVDPVAGRLYMRADAADLSEPGIVIFDAGAAALLGKIQSPLPVFGLGVDAARGRLYAIAAELGEQPKVSAVVAATRGVTVDQGSIVPLSLHAPPDAAALPRVLVDPIRQRLFWELDDEEGAYAVLADRIPFHAPASPLNPDANTVNVAEGKGTGVSFSGGGRAFGARLRWVNGVSGITRNLPLPAAELEDATSTVLAQGSRELHFARGLGTSLSNNEATARAIGAQFDQANTAADFARYQELIRGFTGGDEEEGGDDLAGSLWPYAEANCADFSGEQKQAATRGADSSCDLKRAEALVRTIWRPDQHADLEIPSEPVAITVGQATSSSRTYRDAVRGIVSVADAEARHVEIGGVVEIGRVTAHAESAARGRPGTAGASFTRTISDVVVHLPDGTTRQVCTDPCSLEAVRDAVNRIPGSRVRIDIPRSDAQRIKGTPGGYEALVVRDAFEQANDRYVNEEADIRLEVPAIEITVFADGRVSSRAVLSLAGVSTESHYGIFRLARELPPGVRPPDIDLPDGGGGGIGGAGPGLPGGPAGPGGVGELIRRTLKSLKVFLASPGHTLRAFAFWAFLAAPLLLIRRRRALGARRGR